MIDNKIKCFITFFSLSHNHTTKNSNEKIGNVLPINDQEAIISS